MIYLYSSPFNFILCILIQNLIQRSKMKQRNAKSCYLGPLPHSNTIRVMSYISVCFRMHILKNMSIQASLIPIVISFAQPAYLIIQHLRTRKCPQSDCTVHPVNTYFIDSTVLHFAEIALALQSVALFRHINRGPLGHNNTYSL